MEFGHKGGDAAGLCMVYRLFLAQQEREFAKLLIQSLENDSHSDAEIKAELNCCLNDLLSSKDAGLSFEQVFGVRA